MKFYFLLLLAQLSLGLEAKVEVRPLGVASLLIEDGTTRILIDAPFTRPGLLHWLGLKKFKSDPELVSRVLRHHGLKTLDGIFISHSHFDHSVDAPLVALQTTATLYADASLETIARAYKESELKISSLRNGEALQVGSFKITPVEIDHEKVLGFHFLPGKVEKDFDFDFYDYRVGRTWLYLIEHPEGKILIEDAEKTHLKDLQKFRPDILKVDVLIQGVSRGNKEDLVDGSMKTLKPKIFIPTHFDNFFVDYDPEKFRLLPWSHFKADLEWIQAKMPEVKIIHPKLGESITVL